MQMFKKYALLMQCVENNMKKIFLIMMCFYTSLSALAYPENDTTFLFSNESNFDKSSVKFNPATGNAYIKNSQYSYTNVGSGETYYNYSDSMVETSSDKSYIKLNSGDYFRID